MWYATIGNLYYICLKTVVTAIVYMRVNLTRITSPPISTTGGFRVIFSVLFSSISFSSFTFTGAPYRIFLLFLPWLPSHFYPVIIEQKQHVYCVSKRGMQLLATFIRNQGRVLLMQLSALLF